MDPLSLISSCVSIIQAIEILYKVARDNVHSSSFVKSQLGALITKCLACKGIIEGIKLQAELDKENTSRFFLLEQVGAPIQALQNAIQLIAKKLERLPRHVVFGKVIGNSLESCMKTFDDTLQVLQLAMQADQFSIVTRALGHVQEIGRDVRYLSAAVDRLTYDLAGLTFMTNESSQLQRDEARQRELSSWLSGFDPEQLYYTLAEKAHPGTGLWFIEGSFNTWLRNEEESAQVLWLHGKSGTGKTTLATSIITYLKRREKRPNFGYFFCSVSLRDTRALTNMLGSFVIQLCNQRPELWHLITIRREDIVRRQPGIVRKLETDEVVNLLTEICNKLEEVVLIVDAPNECDSPKKLFRTMKDLLHDVPGLKLFISSTPDLDKTSFDQETIFSVSMMHDAINADIKQCIESRIENDEQLQDFPVDLKREILVSIVDRADGSFRFAECQLSAIIENAVSPAEIRHTLNELSSSLEELYTDVLAAVPSKHVRFLRAAFLWLAFAVRPLSIVELQEAVILRQNFTQVTDADRLFPGMTEILLAKCRMLINYDAGTDQVTLAHSSVQDFLFSDACRQGRANQFRLDVDESVCSLLCLTVTYLNMDILVTGYCSSMDDFNDRITKCPLLLYASDAWPDLSERAPWHIDTYRASAEPVLQKFFDSATKPRGANFGCWIQIYEPRKLRFALNVSNNQPLSSPLYYAARSGLLAVADVIIRVYGNITLEIPGGSRTSTPLHVAAAYGHSGMVELLLSHGADPDEHNIKGERGIAWADHYGYQGIVQLYLSYGARPLTTDDRAMIPKRPKPRGLCTGS